MISFNGGPGASRCLDKKTITPAQRVTLIVGYKDRRGTGRWIPSLWEQACVARGWNKNDRELRLQQFSLILGRPITSASEIGYLKEFDKIKQQLLAWAQPANLNAQVEMENMAKTRLIHRICSEFPASYILGLMRSSRFDNGRPVASIEDLEHWTEKDLIDLRTTLCARNPNSPGPAKAESAKESAALALDDPNLIPF